MNILTDIQEHGDRCILDRLSLHITQYKSHIMLNQLW